MNRRISISNTRGTCKIIIARWREGNWKTGKYTRSLASMPEMLREILTVEGELKPFVCTWR